MKIFNKITLPNPPKTIDDLRKKFGVGKYRGNPNTLRKKLIRNKQLTGNPFFSFKEDKHSKRLIITYTKLQPSKNEKGVLDRYSNGNPIMKKSKSLPHYCNDFTLPLTETTFDYFIKYVINFQNELNKEDREIQNMYSSQSQMLEVYVDDFLNSRIPPRVVEKTYKQYQYIMGYFLLYIKRMNNPHPPYLFNKYQIERVRKENPNLNVGLDTDFSTFTKMVEFEGRDGREIILKWINYLQTPSKLRSYGGVVEGDDMVLSSIKSYWVVIKLLFNWLFRNGLINDNPIRYISKNDLPKFYVWENKQRKRLTPTDYDIEKLYEWILNERDNPPNVGRWVNQKRFGFNWLLPMLMVWMKSGVRNDTLCWLELRNVKWDENTIKYEKNKNEKEGLIWLDDDLKEWLKPLIIDDKTNKVFTNRKYIFVGKKGKKFNVNFVDTYFLKIRKELKEKYPQYNYRLTIHSFRRYFINKNMRMGMGLSLIRKSVNHSNYNTLLKYENDIIYDEELPTTTLPTPLLGDDKPTKEDIRRNIESKIEKLYKELKST